MVEKAFYAIAVLAVVGLIATFMYSFEKTLKGLDNRCGDREFVYCAGRVIGKQVYYFNKGYEEWTETKTKTDRK